MTHEETGVQTVKGDKITREQSFCDGARQQCIAPDRIG
jgi:hypothetical protein